MRDPCRSAILSHSLACDERSSPDPRHLIGVMTPGCYFCWRFAAIKHWPDAPPKHTPVPLRGIPMLIRDPLLHAMACAFDHSLVSSSYLTLVLRVAQTSSFSSTFLTFSATKHLALYVRWTGCLSQPVWLNRVVQSFNSSISAAVERSAWKG
jgi:hypothetical protein